MSINANRLVSITPRVISGGSADLETNGLILTANTLIQGNVPAIEFNTVKEVGDFFGFSSAEYLAAEQYFIGVNNQSKAITTLWFGRILTTAGSGWLRAGKTVTLDTLKAITNGAFGIKVDGNTKTLTGLDFSSATSFGDVATVITTGLTGAVCSYDSVQKKFVITSATTGATSIIDYGTAPASGTDLTALLGLDASGGAVQSLGNDALTVAQNMDAITAVTRNFVGFTTLVKASDNDAVSYAAWADLDDDYVYFYWSDDTTLLSKSTNQASVPVTLQAYNTTACIYGSIYDAVFMLAVGASIKWNSSNALKTWFAKNASGLTAKVLSDTEAEALDSIRTSYIGQFATRNANFIMLNRGYLSGSYYGFIDVLYGAIWLRARLQRGLMDCFNSQGRVPYNSEGYNIVSCYMADAINEAVNNGVIDNDLTLSEGQKAQIMSEVGEDITIELATRGWWYRIDDPTPSDRADRQSPVMAMYYTYAGSIQKIDFPLTTVL